MNIETADYGAIITFGSLDDVLNKLQLCGQSIEDIVDIKNNSGVSLLEKSLIAGKFDISKFFLENGAKVNIVSKDGYNELHYLAANINLEGATNIGRMLLNRNVSLMQRDEKYGNSAYFSLCIEGFKCRTDDVMEFLEECYNYVTDIDEKNNSGYSIRDLLSERGTEELKKRMK